MLGFSGYKAEIGIAEEREQSGGKTRKSIRISIDFAHILAINPDLAIPNTSL
jgi:hypothetical protein